VYEPSVAFDGSGRLVSTLTSDLNVDRNLIWFVVFKPAGTLKNNGLFGTSDSTTRFGGFFSADTTLRCMAYNSNNANYQRHLTITQGAWQMADYQRVYSGSGYYLSASLNGFEADSTHAATQSAPTLTNFKIGDDLNDSDGITDFIGEIAELRVYSRALMDVERVIVQNHLAARYGLSLATNNFYAGVSALNGECDIDVVGIGCVTNVAGYVEGTVSQSESSSGLILADAADTLNDAEFVLAGHAGVDNFWKRLGGGSAATRCWNREWYVDKTAVDGVDAELIFNFTDAGVSLYGPEAEPVYLLLYRADASAVYQDAGVAGVLDGEALTFALDDAALVDGLYTVGVLLPSSGTLILVR
jgi:hypothetical protein